MMDLEKAVAMLAATYKDEFSDDRVKAYMGLLEDLEGQAVLPAVMRLCKREKFSASVAEIRREVAEMRVALPSPVAAYAMSSDSTVLDLPTEVRDALNLMGGRYALKNTTEPGIFRAQFLKIYEEIREAALLRVIEGREPSPSFAALPASPSLVLRPVAARLAKRLEGSPLEPVTDEEKGDAIKILAEGPIVGDGTDDLLFAEASRLLDEEGR